MIKKHESEAGQSAVFFILILHISSHYNFLDIYATALTFPLISNPTMLFQTMPMMSTKTVWRKGLGHGFMHRVNRTLFC
jgi:hypothetical protein